MAEGSSARKSRFLGMAFGTANGRLRKMIMFDLLRRLGEDVCFRCGRQIESVDDLSIEHKEPWEGRSVELFWDLTNIAFSHLKCNIGAAVKLNKIEAPEGRQWCSGCKVFHDVAAFGKINGPWSKRNGRRLYCRTWASKQRAEYRARTGKR